MRLPRTWVMIVVWVVVAAIALECTSSYVLYRKNSRVEKSFFPSGLATVALAKLFYYRLYGRKVFVSSAQSPVFYAESTFGYAAHPGHYEIDEEFDGHKHRFQLTINDAGMRATSYFPVHSSRHIFILGDSSIFGWGLNDEDSLPWLLQARLPQYEVANWSQTGYSAVHALLQLRAAKSDISSDDVVVLAYHPLTIELTGAMAPTFRDFADGLESQLADSQFANSINFPFGTLDANGNLAIQRVNLSCFRRFRTDDCKRGEVDTATAVKVTERAFDEIISLKVGKLLIAVVGGTDPDPVVSYLRAKGVAIVDLRPAAADPETKDVILTDAHGGPFWSHLLYGRLLSALQSNNFIQ